MQNKIDPDPTKSQSKCESKRCFRLSLALAVLFALFAMALGLFTVTQTVNAPTEVVEVETNPYTMGLNDDGELIIIKDGKVIIHTYTNTELEIDLEDVLILEEEERVLFLGTVEEDGVRSKRMYNQWFNEPISIIFVYGLPLDLQMRGFEENGTPNLILHGEPWKELE